MLPKAIQKRHGATLPHWRAKNSIYSVTFRLFDSVPKEILKQWEWEREDIVQNAKRQKRDLTRNERIELKNLQRETIETYLRSGKGSCFMNNTNVASIIAKALLFFEQKHYKLYAWCIMPNHVHAIVQPYSEYDLSKILHSWKSFTAREANKILGREGRFWQREYYDRIIRNRDELERCMEYVWENPDIAHLKNWRWRWKTNIQD